MSDLTRPIIGIENRTAQEVFDIMCDRFKSRAASATALVIAAREVAYDFAVQEAMGKERSDALDKALEPFAALIGWEDDPANLDPTSGDAAAEEPPFDPSLANRAEQTHRQWIKEAVGGNEPQPVQPDLEVVAWRWRDDDKEQWRTDCSTWYPGHEGAMRARHSYVEPLVRLTDAQARIAALTAKVNELHGRLFVETEAVTFYRATSIDNRRRAETAEARVAQLEEALDPFVRHLDEMKFDIDHEGNELPGEQTCGWIYLTLADFRRARAALGGQSNE